MIYLKPFKLFEEAGVKPSKKFPTEKAIHWDYLLDILKDNNINPYDGDERLIDFCFAKCSDKKNIVFPNVRDSEAWKDKVDKRYEEFIFKESVFLLPISYDPSNDESQFITKKKNFFDNMLSFAKQQGKLKEEQDKFLKDLETHVKFGPKSYDWANKYLKMIHDKLGQYYENGKLRVWLPADVDDDYWKNMDYPHKYERFFKGATLEDGVYYLSDIEKYIDDKYGIEDKLFYQFIIHNQYVEGRYWERIWYLRNDQDGYKHSNKLQKSNFGKYGMEPTENILYMLNIIEHEFGNEFGLNGFPIYVDYYKKIKSQY